MQSFWLIFQLLICLALGFVLARRLPKWLERLAFQILPYFTYILLIAIAVEFSTTLHSIAQPLQILNHAALLAVMTSLGAFVCCYILFKLLGYQPSHGKVSMSLVTKSLINISYAFIALGLGMLWQSYHQVSAIPFISAHGTYSWFSCSSLGLIWPIHHSIAHG